MARRGRGEGSVFQRHDHPTCPAEVDGPPDEDGKPTKVRPDHRCRGHWVALVEVGGSGKRRRKWLYGRTGAEVRAKLRKAQAEQQRRAMVLDSPTVEVWLRHWLDEIAPDRIRPSTIKGYTTYIEQHLIPRIGKLRLDRLEPGNVRRLYADMRKPCPEKLEACPEPDDDGVCRHTPRHTRCPHDPTHGLAEASIRQAHAILSRALKVAEREGKVARNVCELIDPPGTGKNPRTPLTLAEARAVLAAAEGDPLESRWYAALWLGLRQGEALGLMWADVNLDEGALYISRELQRVKGKGLVFMPPKSRTSTRRVPVPPMVLSRLKVHRAAELNAGRGRPDDLVWNLDGKPMGDKSDYNRWTALLKRAGVPHVALHAARNTAGSLLMAAGVPDKVTAEILGHSSVVITQGHYLRGDDEQHAKAMLALEAMASTLDAE